MPNACQVGRSCNCGADRRRPVNRPPRSSMARIGCAAGAAILTNQQSPPARPSGRGWRGYSGCGGARGPRAIRGWEAGLRPGCWSSCFACRTRPAAGRRGHQPDHRSRQLGRGAPDMNPDMKLPRLRRKPAPETAEPASVGPAAPVLQVVVYPTPTCRSRSSGLRRKSFGASLVTTMPPAAGTAKFPSTVPSGPPRCSPPSSTPPASTAPRSGSRSRPRARTAHRGRSYARRERVPAHVEGRPCPIRAWLQRVTTGGCRRGPGRGPVCGEFPVLPVHSRAAVRGIVAGQARAAFERASHNPPVMRCSLLLTGLWTRQPE